MKLQKSYYTGKIMDSSTQTVPDQNMGIRELVDRHTRGVPLGVNSRKGEYFDTEIPIFEDLTDMLEHKKILQGKMREHNVLIKAQKEKDKLAKEQNAKIKTSTPVENTETQKKDSTS